jgi:cytoskeleton protein RodZ
MSEAEINPLREEPEKVVADEAITSPGAHLARQREMRGWTTDQVARQLNLAPRQIQALEEDNHTALPGVASVRGFIRSYAKLLKIDPEPLLVYVPVDLESTITEPIPVRRALSAPFSDDIRSKSRRGIPWLPVVAGVAIVAAIGAYVEGMRFWKNSPSARQIPPAAEASVPRGAAEGSLLPASTALSAAQPPLLPDAVADAGTHSDSVVSGGVNQPPLPIDASHALVIRFKEKSWLEVRRLADGKMPSEMLAARLVDEGTIETFDLRQPLAIVIGNVSGVEAEARGEPFVLKPIGKTNVARMTVK